jgi:hypothetical protein
MGESVLLFKSKASLKKFYKTLYTILGLIKTFSLNNEPGSKITF